MWCRTVRKLIYDYVDGLVDVRLAGKVQDHLHRCSRCASAEEEVRLFIDSLAAWEDVDPPEDGLHRLETRLAFVPKLPALERPRGKLYTLVIPYLAGAASAAAVLLVLLPLINSEEPQPVSSDVSPVAMEETAAPELLPGERELTYREMQAVVDEDGNLIELPPEWRRALERMATERRSPPPYREPGGAVPVDFRER